MTRLTLALLLLLPFATTLAPSTTDAAVPRQISYQGILLDSNGTPFTDGSYGLQFSILGGGGTLWSSSRTVQTLDGLFTVVLGQVTPLVLPFDQPYELAVFFGGGEIARVPLLASPYSLNSASVEDGAVTGPKLAPGAAVKSLNGLSDAVTIQGGTGINVSSSGNTITIDNSGSGTGGGADLDWAVNGNDMYSIPSGRIGVGTTSPTADLHIYGDNGGTTLVLEDQTESAFMISQFRMHTANFRGELSTFQTGGDGTLLLNTQTAGMDLMITSKGDTDFRSSNRFQWNFDGTPRQELSPDGTLTLFDGAGLPTARLAAEDPASGLEGGELRLLRPGGQETIDLDAYATSDRGARLLLREEGGTRTFEVGAHSTTSGGGAILKLYREAGQEAVELRAQEDGLADQGGQVTVFNASGISTAELDGHYGTSGRGSLKLQQPDGSDGVLLDAKSSVSANDGALVRLFNGAGVASVEIDAQEGGLGQGATMKLNNGAGQTTIELDADQGGTGMGRVITGQLEITAGSDLSENFDIGGNGEIPPAGTVMSIDPTVTGRLLPSRVAYDRRVAGVVSGAGGVNPGLLMGQRGSEADGAVPVALTGRVYCLVDASYGPVEPGDLLTTSPTAGHAMRVEDGREAGGATLGKAMGRLESGRGLVLVLVNLQ